MIANLETKKIADLLIVLKKNAENINTEYADGYLSALIDIRYSIANDLRERFDNQAAIEWHEYLVNNS
jgi:hypothetical protein